MTRNEQLAVMERMFTWDEECVGHFKLSFLAQYEILNKIMDACAERFLRLGSPRVDYFVYREYVYVIYAQISLVIECLVKCILEENGYTEKEIRKRGHHLEKLLDELLNISSEEVKDIFSVLNHHREIIEYFVTENVFVNARYMEYKYEISMHHIEKVKGLIIDLDYIYDKYYRNYDIESIVYPDTM